ncbi:MAG TPA: TetR/AcrR family transcriptional regulator [Spirochaetota bacterium]|nr:TetR/AcrR family transcriptional regulator [Spirochaetota bacterium]HOM37727.1 TetR/AcrR family transcriptional regulator [Spirochaetota bacterium]HPQ49685.1 TetR/AcrR family transcriptional regulator [Spirochaetota bacterium]
MKISKKELKAKKIRENIINIAKILFKEQGYRNTTIDNIVDKALLSKATFYQYFTNKEALFIETLKHSKKKLIHKIESEIKKILKLDIKDRIRKIKKIIYNIFSYIEKEPYIIHFIFYGNVGTIETDTISILKESLLELISVLKNIFEGFNMSEKEKEHLVISMVGSGYLHILNVTLNNQNKDSIKYISRMIYKEFIPYILRKIK